jgi:hypothetical protein
LACPVIEKKPTALSLALGYYYAPKVYFLSMEVMWIKDNILNLYLWSVLVNISTVFFC